MLKAITGATIFTTDGPLTGSAIVVKDGYVTSLTPLDAIGDLPVEDHPDSLIAAGLIDLQVYGGGGFLFSNSPSSAALTAICEGLARQGTTGFLLTLATNRWEVFQQAIEVVKQHPHPALLGLHLEGPYINPQKKGAHLEQYICRPDPDHLKRLLQRAEGVVKMMTLAPEQTDPSIWRLLDEHGVIVSAGHSNASFEQGMKAFAGGIPAATHLFNAMSPFHHRDPGLAGAVFQSPQVYASIIADGIHVSYSTLQISKKIMNERLFLITDAVEENLEGPYIHIRKEDHFTLPDGTLSGSSLTLLQAVRNCVLRAGIELPEALRMATLYPSRLAAPERGKIEPGARADVLVFTPDFEVQAVYLQGRNVLGR